MPEKKSINILIGKNIQSARERADFTQEELSELLNITPNHMSAIERGVSGISIETLSKLCTLLGITTDSIIYGDTEDSNSINWNAKMRDFPVKYQHYMYNVLENITEMLADK